MRASDAIADIYGDMYEHGVERDWRDAGAVSKADNIIAAWTRVGRSPGVHVVELGCGEGALAAELVHRSFARSYRGFDLSESGIAEARGRGIPGAEFALTDGGSFPLEDGCADLVVLSHVVEHLEHPRVLLYEAARLAPHVLVEVPLELNSRTPRDYQVDALGHINKYTARSVRHLVQSCGFEVLTQFTTNPEHALFGDASWRRHVSWHLKNLALRTAPRPARSCFTYHETLLLRA